MRTREFFERECTPFLKHLSKTSRFRKKIKKRPTGTTIFGFCFDGGNAVLMAGDRMTINPYSDIHSLHSAKVHPVGTNVLVAGCGLVSDIQMSIRYLKYLSESFSHDIGKEMSSLGKARLFRQLIEFSGGLDAEFILAGYNYNILGYKFDCKAFVRSYDSAGGWYSAKYFADGSGRFEARSVLDNSWNKDMNQKEAIWLAVKAMLQAGKRNTYTGSPFLSPLSIHIIDGNGIHEISEETIERAIGKEKKAYQKRHRDVQEQEVLT